MKKVKKTKMAYVNQTGCFGEFRVDDPVCKKLCAISIRCAIEQDQNTRMEILEDLISSEDMIIKIQ